MRAVIYARISDDRTGQRAGVNRQEADCRALCERNGWAIIGVHVDNDTSAYRGKPRPGWQAVIKALQSDADVLVGWHPDRFTRHVRELEDLIDLVDSTGSTVATVTAGSVDLSTPAGRMQARLAGVIARGESEHRGARVKAASDESMAAGKQWGRGRRAYGYTPDRSQIVPEEAAVIREAARRVLAGESARSVCMDLNERRIPAASGGPWQSTSMLGMLRSGHIAGWREHKGEIVTRAVWPAIIDDITHRRLRNMLNDPARNHGPRKRTYLLRGILVCGRCKRLMSGGTRNKATGQGRVYRCARQPGNNACGRRSITAHPCEEWITEAVFYRARNFPRRPKDTGHLSTRVQDLDAELACLTDDYAEDRITRAQFLALTEATRRKLDAASSALTAAGSVDIPEGDLLRARWAVESFGWRRAVLSKLLVKVEVGEAVRGLNWFDPERLDPTWRV